MTKSQRGAEMTPDERADVLAAVIRQEMDEMKVEEEAKRIRDQAEEVAAQLSRHDRPRDFVGLDFQGSVVYHPNAGAQHDRALTIAGVHYEHTYEDADGVWIYQHLDPR